ncbi:hypothetical protein GCM10007205_27460 [Oxalicibacterium flavum]|uniref:Uncharacterized protein n=1 Tax=Oxalicibacterium flavum TaxID=179467 RepID=A0A8J2XYT1_9BURK|nr:hypothetical protein [Oxalicibacterium flavum]GGC16997.1 hypothetical protein GCM10007205_27460 [Oxalicibacterium flavum]
MITFAIIVILSFVIYSILKGKSRKNHIDYLRAVRDLDASIAQGQKNSVPSWLKNDDKERQFTNAVLALIRKTTVPLTYAVRGFMSPDASAVLFGLAANMETQGATFIEQQIAAVRYIEENWNQLSLNDQDSFRKETLLEEMTYKANIR